MGGSMVFVGRRVRYSCFINCREAEEPRIEDELRSAATLEFL
jgi:hypothetical protein